MGEGLGDKCTTASGLAEQWRHCATSVRAWTADDPGVVDGLAEVADTLDELAYRLLMLDEQERAFDAKADALAQKADNERKSSGY